MSFLTKLDRPKLWDGYTFLLSAAIGDIEDDLILVISGYDAAGALVGSAQESTAAAYTNTVVDFNVNEIYGSLTGVEYLTVYLKTELEEVLTDMRIDVVDPCDNPIYLLGRDSLGGCLQWMFDVNQEYNFDYGNSEKAKRLSLTAVNTTINEWESLQDLIGLGEVYKENIVEFSSSTIKTTSRIGQQLYVVDSTGDRIGVIGIPTKNKTSTKKVKHIFELEIEYPEIF